MKESEKEKDTEKVSEWMLGMREREQASEKDTYMHILDMYTGLYMYIGANIYACICIIKQLCQSQKKRIPKKKLVRAFHFINLI